MAEAILDLEIRTRRLEHGARIASQRLDGIGHAATAMDSSMRRAGTQMDAFGGSMGSAGRSAAASMVQMAALAGVTVGLGAAFASVVREVAGFEKTLDAVAAVTRASKQDMEAMEKTARKLGATTQFSASQAAEGMKFLGMAGFETTQIITAMPAVLDLAMAASMDLGAAADTTSNIMSGFGLAASETTRIADALAAVASSANTDVSQMGEAMKYVGPIAHGMGISMESAAAAVGAMSNAGIQASMAGTGLKAILGDLSAPTEKTAGVIADLNIKMSDLHPATNDLADIIQRLADAGIDGTQALAAFGERGGPALLALTSQIGKLKELNDVISTSSGRAREMAEIMGENLAGSVLDLGSIIGELSLQMGGAGLLSTLTDLVDGTTDVLRVWGAFGDSLGESRDQAKATAEGIQLLAETIGILGGTWLLIAKGPLIFTTLTTAVSSAAIALNVMGTGAIAAKFALSGVGPTATTAATALRVMNTAILGIGVAFLAWEFGTWLRNFEDFRVAGIRVVGALEKAFAHLKHVAGSVIATIGSDWREGLDKLTAHFGRFVQGAGLIMEQIPWMKKAGLAVQTLSLGYIDAENGTSKLKVELAALRAELIADTAAIDANIAGMIEWEQGGKVAAESAEEVAKTARAYEELLDQMGVELFVDPFLSFEAIISDVGVAIASTTDTQKELTKAQIFQKKSLHGLILELDPIQEITERYAGNLAKLSIGYENGWISLEKYTELHGALTDAISSELDATWLRMDAGAQLINTLEEENRLLGLTGSALEFANRTRGMSVEAVSEHEIAIKGLIEQQKKLKDQNKINDEAAKESARFQKEIADNLTRDVQESTGTWFRDILDGKVDSFKSFAGSVFDIFKDLAAKIAAKFVMENIFGGLLGGGAGGGLMDMIGGLFGGGKGGGIMDMIGGFFGGGKDGGGGGIAKNLLGLVASPIKAVTNLLTGGGGLGSAFEAIISPIKTVGGFLKNITGEFSGLASGAGALLTALGPLVMGGGIAMFGSKILEGITDLFFGEDTPTAQLATGSSREYEDAVTRTTALGIIGFSELGSGAIKAYDEQNQAYLDWLAEIDNQLSQVMTSDEIARVRAAREDWEYFENATLARLQQIPENVRQELAEALDFSNIQWVSQTDPEALKSQIIGDLEKVQTDVGMSYGKATSDFIGQMIETAESLGTEIDAQADDISNRLIVDPINQIYAALRGVDPLGIEASFIGGGLVGGGEATPELYADMAREKIAADLDAIEYGLGDALRESGVALEALPFAAIAILQSGEQTAAILSQYGDTAERTRMELWNIGESFQALSAPTEELVSHMAEAFEIDPQEVTRAFAQIRLPIDSIIDSITKTWNIPGADIITAMAGLEGTRAEVLTQLGEKLSIDPAALDDALYDVRVPMDVVANFIGETLGKSQAEILEAFAGADMSGLVSEDMQARLDQFSGSGEELVQEFIRLHEGANFLRLAFEEVGQESTLTSNQMMDFGAAMVEAFGGMESLQHKMSLYYSAFYTEAEKAEKNITGITGAFEVLGLQLPETREGFRKLIEAQDLNTQAGRDTFQSLISLAPAVDGIFESYADGVKTTAGEVEKATKINQKAVQSYADMVAATTPIIVSIGKLTGFTPNFEEMDRTLVSMGQNADHISASMGNYIEHLSMTGEATESAGMVVGELVGMWSDIKVPASVAEFTAALNAIDVKTPQGLIDIGVLFSTWPQVKATTRAALEASEGFKELESSLEKITRGDAFGKIGVQIFELESWKEDQQKAINELGAAEAETLKLTGLLSSAYEIQSDTIKNELIDSLKSAAGIMESIYTPEQFQAKYDLPELPTQADIQEFVMGVADWSIEEIERWGKTLEDVMPDIQGITAFFEGIRQVQDGFVKSIERFQDRLTEVFSVRQEFGTDDVLSPVEYWQARANQWNAELQSAGGLSALTTETFQEAVDIYSQFLDAQLNALVETRGRWETLGARIKNTAESVIADLEKVDAVYSDIPVFSQVLRDPFETLEQVTERSIENVESYLDSMDKWFAKAQDLSGKIGDFGTNIADSLDSMADDVFAALDHRTQIDLLTRDIESRMATFRAQQDPGGIVQAFDVRNLEGEFENAQEIYDLVLSRYDLERQELESVNDVIEKLGSHLARVKDTLFDIRVDEAVSPLLPQARGEFAGFLDDADATTTGRYQELLALAQGPQAEEADKEKFLAFVQPYLEQARSFYATSPEYVEIWKGVQSDLEGMGTGAEDALSVQEETLPGIHDSVTESRDILNELKDAVDPWQATIETEIRNQTTELQSLLGEQGAVTLGVNDVQSAIASLHTDVSGAVTGLATSLEAILGPDEPQEAIVVDLSGVSGSLDGVTAAVGGVSGSVDMVSTSLDSVALGMSDQSAQLDAIGLGLGLINQTLGGINPIATQERLNLLAPAAATETNVSEHLINIGLGLGIINTTMWSVNDYLGVKLDAINGTIAGQSTFLWFRSVHALLESVQTDIQNAGLGLGVINNTLWSMNDFLGIKLDAINGTISGQSTFLWFRSVQGKLEDIQTDIQNVGVGEFYIYKVLEDILRAGGGTPSTPFQGFETGTAFVPQDMTANIHQGEMVIDRQSSDVLRKYGIADSGNKEIVLELQKTREQQEADNEELRREIAALRAEMIASREVLSQEVVPAVERQGEVFAAEKRV